MTSKEPPSWNGSWRPREFDYIRTINFYKTGQSCLFHWESLAVLSWSKPWLNCKVFMLRSGPWHPRNCCHGMIRVSRGTAVKKWFVTSERTGSLWSEIQLGNLRDQEMLIGNSDREGLWALYVTKWFVTSKEKCQVKVFVKVKLRFYFSSYSWKFKSCCLNCFTEYMKKGESTNWSAYRTACLIKKVRYNNQQHFSYML